MKNLDINTYSSLPHIAANTAFAGQVPAFSAYNAMPSRNGAVISLEDGLNGIAGANVDPLLTAFINGANADKMAVAHPADMMRSFSTGGDEANLAELQAELDFIAPQVPSGRAFKFRQWNEDESFVALTDDEDKRALKEDFNVIDRTGSIASGSTANKGLAVCIDADEFNGSDLNQRDIERDEVARLKYILVLTELIRAHSLLNSSSQEIKKTGPVAFDWTASTAQPDHDLRAVSINGQRLCGRKFNGCVMSDRFWHESRGVYLAQDNAGAYAGAARTPADVAGYTGLGRDGGILVSDSVYVDRTIEAAGNKRAKTIGTDAAAIFFVRQARPGRMDPSSIKRFVASSTFNVYRWQVGPKLTFLAVDHYSSIIAVAPGSIKHIAPTLPATANLVLV